MANPDAKDTLRLSERRYVFSPKVKPKTGTMTWISATLTIRDLDGAPIGDENRPVTGLTSGATNAGQAWFFTAPADLNLEPDNDYDFSFKMTDNSTPAVVVEPVVRVTIETDGGS